MVVIESSDVVDIDPKSCDTGSFEDLYQKRALVVSKTCAQAWRVLATVGWIHSDGLVDALAPYFVVVTPDVGADIVSTESDKNKSSDTSSS